MEKLPEHVRKQGFPVARASGGLQCLPQGFQLVYEFAQLPGQAGLQAADFAVGLHAAPGFVLAHAVAQQHGAKAGLPGVAFQLCRQVQAFPVATVQAPADVGAFHPAPGQGNLVFADAKAAPDAGYFQQADDFTHAETAAGQRHQGFQGNQHRFVVALALVGNGKGNVAFAARLVAAEDRLNVGRIDVDIRHHHDDIPGPKVRVGIEGGQQLIVQDFHFPLGAVGRVEGQGMVVEQIQLALLFPDFLQRGEVVDIVLQLEQQAGGFTGAMFREDVDLLVRGLEAAAVVVRVVELVQQPDVVPALLAPGGQQRVGVLVQLVRVGNLCQYRVGHTPFALGFQQFPITDDIGPVELAGVVNTQHHLAEAAEHV